MKNLKYIMNELRELNLLLHKNDKYCDCAYQIHITPGGYTEEEEEEEQVIEVIFQDEDVNRNEVTNTGRLNWKEDLRNLMKTARAKYR